MKLHTALKLGRVSNLPTVWSNVLAGCVLAAGTITPSALVLLGLAASLFYVGGMYLNDAFDADIDAKERPERPIPAGEVSRRAVSRLGFGMLAAGFSLVVLQSQCMGGSSWALVAAAITIGLIVVYNRWHKGNPLGPVLMGMCRMGIYAFAGFATTARPDARLYYGAFLLLLYVLGLTYVAKHENTTTLGRSWPRACLYIPLVYALPLLRGVLLTRMLWAGFGMWVSRSIDFAKRREPQHTRTAVVSLIAGISLLDALLIAGAGLPTLSLAAVATFGATLALQRKIAGT